MVLRIKVQDRGELSIGATVLRREESAGGKVGLGTGEMGLDESGDFLLFAVVANLRWVISLGQGDWGVAS